jgi:hypothetical protein
MHLKISDFLPVWFIKYCTVLFLIFSFTRCALQQPPTGGKKDIIPPKLIKSIPENKSLNFVGNEIILVFDEYVDIDPLIKQQLIITPGIEDYNYKPIKKGIRITLNKPLKPNTTYTFNFRKAIKDLNEKNPAQNLKLVFSTGNYIDSLKINGNALYAENNKPLIDGIVSLYKVNDTLDIFKHKPLYFTRTDSAGRYVFENLQKGIYKVYALTDNNNNLTYQERSEKIGFTDTDILLQDSSRSAINILLSKIDQTAPLISGRGVEENYTTLEFNEGLKTVKAIFLNPSDSIPYHQSNEKTVLFYNTIHKFDSIPVRIIAEDSSKNILDKEIKIKFTASKKEKSEKNKSDKIKFETKVYPDKGEKILKDFKVKIVFNKPIKSLNYQTVNILSDTIRKIDLLKEDTSWNIYHTEFTIQKKVNFSNKLRLQMPKGAFISIENDSSANIKNDYSLKNEEDYGIISGSINMQTPENFIIQLVTTDYKLVAEKVNIMNYKFDFIEPGQYLVKVIIDKNKNGVWDNGNLKQKILPEKVYILGPITMKQNFEMTENNFNLP